MGILKRLPKITWIAAIVVILLEAFVFNYKCFLPIHDTDIRYYTTDELVKTGMKSTEEKNCFIATTDAPSVVCDINQKVQIVYLNAEAPKDTAKMNVRIEHTDDTRSNYMVADAGVSGLNKTMEVIQGYPLSRYVTCNYSGSTHSMRFTFQVNKGTMFRLESIGVNVKPPLEFDWMRMLVLYGSILFVGMLFQVPGFAVPYTGINKIQLGALVFVFVIFSALTIGLFQMYAGEIKEKDFQLNAGNQVSKELVDAFEAGSVSLLEEPEEALLALENPYDYSQRVLNGTQYPWDHVLYEGKYYSYYGIVPVFLVYLPYHLLTGYYYPTTALCLWSVLLGSLFIGMTYLELVRRWLAKTPFFMVLYGLILLLFSSGLLFCVVRPDFYEAQSAFAFLMFAVSSLLLVHTGIFTDRSAQPGIWKIAAGTFFMGMAVLSRPTFALYAVSTLVLLMTAYPEYRRQFTGKMRAAYLLAAFGPLVVLGIVQMTYNYLRFGSVLEFGIQYSLTINDFTQTSFHVKTAFVALWSFLFALPQYSSSFPFLHSIKDLFGLNGAYYSDTTIMTGLFVRVLPLFSILGLPWLAQGEGKAHRKWKWWLRKGALLGLPCVLFPIIIILSTWESGHALRYNVDFASMLFFAAVFIVFSLYNRESNRAKKLLRSVFLICTIWCVITTLGTIFQLIPNVTRPIGNSDVNGTIAYYRLAHRIAFWN